MLKETPQETVRMRNRSASNVKGTFNTQRVGVKHHIPGLPRRHGISQQVLNSAERLMREYQADLDYLKDR
jgi:hypothetical protein